MHSDRDDLCDFLKCGKLGRIISIVGDCVRANPLKKRYVKKKFISKSLDTVLFRTRIVSAQLSIALHALSLLLCYFINITAYLCADMSSVTRFGKFLPIWQNIWQSFVGSFSNLQKFEPNLGNICAIGQIFNVANDQMLKQII